MKSAFKWPLLSLALPATTQPILSWVWVTGPGNDSCKNLVPCADYSAPDGGMSAPLAASPR